MDASGLDHDACEGFEGDDFAVGFEVSFAFEDDVDFGHPFMVVGTACGVDVGEVYGGRGIWHICEGASCFSAGARDGGDGIELGDVEPFHGRWKVRGSWCGSSSMGWKMKLLE